MCYSAAVVADYRRYVRQFGAQIDLAAFEALYFRRASDARIRIPKAMDAAFSEPRDAIERRIATLIAQFNAAQTAQLEAELFKQRKRLADAERVLKTKTTKAALENQRIATDKIAWAQGKLADLRRTDLKPRDSRIFPLHYAPVMIEADGARVVRPMRYLCRPSGKKVSFDQQFPGCYNSRRDNLEAFWRGQFTHTHAVVLMTAFYENVSRHRLERRELAPGEADENVVLEFQPSPAHEMHVACLYSHWEHPGHPDLWSFAAITDEPPPEVAAAGHDRCIIPLRPENVGAWLTATSPAQAHALLDDRERPYYEHRRAA